MKFPLLTLAPALLAVVSFAAHANTAFVWLAPCCGSDTAPEPVLVGEDLTIRVERGGNLAQPASVEVEFVAAAPDATFSWINGIEAIPATAGRDFLPSTQRIDFQPGESLRLIVAPVLDNGRRDETFLFFHARLTNPTEGLSVDSVPRTLVTGENELPTTFDVTRPTRYLDANPLVLLTKDMGQPTTGIFQPHGDGSTLIWGEFNAVNGVPRRGHARLDREGELDETYDPLLKPLLPGGNPLSDGRTLKVEFLPRKSFNEIYFLRLFRPDGTPDPAWVDVGLAGADNQDGKVYGEFYEIQGKLHFTGRLRSINGIPVAHWASDTPYEFHFFLTNAPRSRLQVGIEVISPWTGVSFHAVYFRRLGATDTPAKVDYATRDLTAVAGTDYFPQSGSLTFAPRELCKVVTIPILHGALGKYAKEFEVVVTAADGFEELPAPIRGRTTSDNPVFAPRLDRVKRLRDGRVLLGGSASVDGSGGVIQFSNDLKSWHPLTNATGGLFSDHGPSLWLDPSATNAATRYYRAVAP